MSAGGEASPARPARDPTRATLIAAMAAVAILAWIWLLRMTGDLPGFPGMVMAMPMFAAWTAGEVALIFLMWAVMMVAMMTPSALPMVLALATIDRKQRADGKTPPGRLAFFLLAYALIWIGFSAVATLLQWALHWAALLSPYTITVGRVTGATVLLAAGLYQWLPAKRACLVQCRSPLDFIIRHWRPGSRGAFEMGVRHGLYCLGCCWAVMLLLFVAGVMNLLWVAAIALFVTLEKTAPMGEMVGRAGGLLMMAGAAWIAFAGG